MILKENKVKLPRRGNEKRTLRLRVPRFYNYIIEAPTRVGYEVVNMHGNYDSVHRRTLWLMFLGFGLEYEVKWNGNGRHES